jgi:RNA polymerase sigma factor (sigma-70 family)
MPGASSACDGGVTSRTFVRIVSRLADLDFSALYRRHAGDVYRFALYLSGDASQADDITAETFTRAWIARDRIRVDSVRAYLLMIARNLYRDALRKPADAAIADQPDPRDRSPDPEAAAQARGELESVLRALRLIPELDRAVLLMATVEQLPHHSIGAALGLSVGAVKVRLHRARVKLNAARARESDDV